MDCCSTQELNFLADPEFVCREAPEAFLYAFDLLELDRQDLRRKAWEARRKALARRLRGVGQGVRLSEHMDGEDGPAMFRHASAMGLEGIVSNRRDAAYRSGRSSHWIKLKNPNALAMRRVGSSDESDEKGRQATEGEPCPPWPVRASLTKLAGGARRAPTRTAKQFWAQLTGFAALTPSFTLRCRGEGRERSPV